MIGELVHSSDLHWRGRLIRFHAKWILPAWSLRLIWISCIIGALLIYWHDRP